VRFSSRTRTAILVLLVGGVGAASGVFVQQRFGQDTTPDTREPADTPAVLDGRRPDFVLPDLEGRPRDISEWDGQLLVLNFWATWCGPCVHEIPMLNELQQTHAGRGLQVIGIAIDDPDKVKHFQTEVPMAYPTLLGQMAAIEVARRYGNASGGLPYTVVVDPAGTVVATHAGALTRPEAEALVSPYLGPT
jgi:thiol-disulfide isomerase/thioredoxin